MRNPAHYGGGGWEKESQRYKTQKPFPGGEITKEGKKNWRGLSRVKCFGGCKGVRKRTPKSPKECQVYQGLSRSEKKGGTWWRRARGREEQAKKVGGGARGRVREVWALGVKGALWMLRRVIYRGKKKKQEKYSNGKKFPHL